LEQILANYSSDQIEKASTIKAIFFDVDGVLTDGKIIYDEAGNEIKRFSVRDGLIIAHLRKAGIITGVISGRESASVARRCAELKMDFCYQGISDKSEVCNKLMEEYRLKKSEVLFIGDDINDLPVFKKVGISVCPADAATYIQDNVDLVTSAKGGDGVVREIADLVLSARGDMEKIING